MEVARREVRVRREAGSFVGACNCGERSEALPGPGDAVAWIVEHARAVHPDFLPTVLASVHPPAEYCADPVPVADFVALMHRMMADPTTPAEPRAPAPQRRRRRSARP